MPEDLARYQLPVGEHLEIFNKDIVPLIFPGIARAEAPVLVVIAGQNGAGKSTTFQRVANEVDPRPVSIDGDQIREVHPAWLTLSRRDPELANLATYPDMSAWIDESLREALDRRCNVIVETTLRRLDPTVDMLKRFREAGYTCQLEVVAVPPEISGIGIVARYEAAYEQQGFGRHVPLEIHDEAANAIGPHSAQLEERQLIDKINVRSRFGEICYSNELSATGWQQPPAAGEAIRDLHRDLRPHLEDARRTLRETADRLRRRGPTPSQEATLAEITHRFNTWPGPGRPSPQKMRDAARAKRQPSIAAPRDKPQPSRKPRPG